MENPVPSLTFIKPIGGDIMKPIKGFENHDIYTRWGKAYKQLQIRVL